jgi:hypothetical protein
LAIFQIYEIIGRHLRRACDIELDQLGENVLAGLGLFPETLSRLALELRVL